MKKAIFVALSLLYGAFADAQTANLSPEQAREENAYTLGVQAYLWGAPLLYCGETLVAGVKAGAVGIAVNGNADLPKAVDHRITVDRQAFVRRPGPHRVD